MKKIVTLLVALVAIFSLAGCKSKEVGNVDGKLPNNQIEDVKNNDKAKLPTQYAEFIDEFKKYMFNYQYAEDENITDKIDISYLYIYDENIAEKNCKYTLVDLNNDGVQELLMYVESENKDYDNIIYDMYTIIDNQLVHVLSSFDRDRYMLYNDGIIYEEGASSAFDSIEAYYKLGTDGKLTLVEKYDITSNPETEENTITKTTIVDGKAVSGVVSNEEYNNAKAKYTNQVLELKSI